MSINNINDNSLEKVSGAGPRWTEEEKSQLISLIKSGKYYTPHFEGYNWEKIADVLNAKYLNDRTAKACEGMFRKLGGDTLFLG